MSIKCCGCGGATEFEEVFHKVRRSFRRQKVFYCPLCWAKQHRRLLQFQFLLLVALCIISIVLVVLASENTTESLIGWIALNLCLGYLLLFLQILPHELGHALMARLLGWRVFKIAMGQGRNLCRFGCGRLLFEINAIPSGGLTTAASKSASYYRLKRFLFILAGPLTNAVMLTAVLILVPAPQLLARLPGTYLFIWLALIGSCFVLLIGNLFPFRNTVVFGPLAERIDSDGLALLTAFFLSPDVIQQRQALYYLLEGFDSFHQSDYKAAKQWHEQGLVLRPQDISNRVLLAFALLFLKEFHAARSQWLLLLEREDLPKAQRTTIVNNLAWTDMVIGGKEMLAEADWLSQEAVQQQPWNPSFQGTRGGVLIEMGEVEKGLPLVRQAFDANDDLRLKALNACYLALGEYQRGNLTEAQRLRDLAQKLDSQCILLAKVDQALTIGAASV